MLVIPWKAHVVAICVVRAVFTVNIKEDGKYAFFTEHMPFEFESDEGFEVEIRKEGYVIESGRNKSTGVLREVHYIKQGAYKITADLEQIPGGRFGFGKIEISSA